MKLDRPAQIENLLEAIKKSIETEDYKFSSHASKRSEQRFISYNDALHVLASGVHEERKTTFDPRYRTWKYAIRGKTVDGFDTRVIVAFQKGMIIITVIKLIVMKKSKKNRRKP